MNCEFHNQAERLAHLFDQVGALSRSRAFAQLMQLNLSISHMHALRHIASSGEVPMKELAERMQMTPPSVTALARRLEATGLVERARHAEDSRVWLLQLTDEGRQLWTTIREQRIDLMQQLLDTLSAEDQQTLLTLLDHATVTAEQLINEKIEEEEHRGSNH